MKLHKKIQNLRNFFNLNRAEFSEKTNIPLNTIKSIELKGSVPGGEILVAIAKTWPEYAAWILLGNDEINVRNKGDFNIIDSVDVRFMEQCVIKRERLKKLIFLQSDKTEDLSALLVIEKSIFNRSTSGNGASNAVWLKTGNMNFSRRKGGGWSVLKDFRKWLMETNSDLISQAEFYHVDQSILCRQSPLPCLVKESLKPTIDDDRYHNFLHWQNGSNQA